MKHWIKYVIVTWCWLSAFTVLAQPVSKRDKIDALRVEFIKEKLNLTSQEGQAFWPLYNEYNDKLDLVRRAFRQQYGKNTDVASFSDKEAEAYLNAELNLKQKEYELYKEYFDKFKRVLPVKKVALLRRSEEDFRKELIKNIKTNAPEQ